MPKPEHRRVAVLRSDDVLEIVGHDLADHLLSGAALDQSFSFRRGLREVPEDIDAVRGQFRGDENVLSVFSLEPLQGGTDLARLHSCGSQRIQHVCLGHGHERNGGHAMLGRLRKDVQQRAASFVAARPVIERLLGDAEEAGGVALVEQAVPSPDVVHAAHLLCGSLSSSLTDSMVHRVARRLSLYRAATLHAHP
ncbi:hypothetical protein ITP53_01305 [Nonomuraea sp. K274]|uniref:Uncharacterized protein n=1 Tax=Nonomuraea cypriaca TaxID=1187855 RepID=A0A931A6T0_9ACTN|nr:hypothetical protein [Nonomuraea cypriaca]MBF8184405.1 hypothetical protein [Nonomuraea cypriaca]